MVESIDFITVLDHLVSSVCSSPAQWTHISKICPCNIPVQRIFSAVKIENFIWKNYDIFNIFAQNMDCGYSPRRF